jgi:uncharacterized membrane protein YeiH
MQTLILVLDLIGTFVFALSGATAGVQRRLDIFGVLVVSFVAGNCGGIMRDVLIGAVPPGAISDWRYLAAAIAAGVLTFYGYPIVDRLRSPVLLFDAAGLALFAVIGTQKALAFGLNPGMAALMGMLTGIGGGIVRDVLVSEIPAVLRADLYAVAALAGAAIVALGHVLHAPSAAAIVAGAIACFGLRFMAIRRGWHLPSAHPPERTSESVPHEPGATRDQVEGERDRARAGLLGTPPSPDGPPGWQLTGEVTKGGEPGPSADPVERGGPPSRTE